MSRPFIGEGIEERVSRRQITIIILGLSWLTLNSFFNKELFFHK
jgi:hypothetical protein